MIDLMTLLLGILIAIDLVIFGVSRMDKRSGYFYTLLMMMDTVVVGTLLLARFQ